MYANENSGISNPFDKQLKTAQQHTLVLVKEEEFRGKNSVEIQQQSKTLCSLFSLNSEGSFKRYQVLKGTMLAFTNCVMATVSFAWRWIYLQI